MPGVLPSPTVLTVFPAFAALPTLPAGIPLADRYLSLRLRHQRGTLSFRVDPTPDLLFITLDGVITVADLASAAEAVVVAETHYRHAPDQLVDMTQVVDFGISFADILGRAESRRKRTLPNRIRCAILTASPVQFGLGRMYEALLDHPQIAVTVFRDRGEALHWLGRGPAGLAGGHSA